MPDLQTELSKINRQEPTVPEHTKVVRSVATCTPNFVKKLADELGNQTEAARLIGMTGSGLSTAVMRNKISLVAEIAAKGVLAEIEARKAGRAERRARNRLLLVAVPPDKWTGFKAVTEAMAITVTELEV